MSLVGIRRRCVLAVLAGLCAAVGCQLTPAPGLVECPLTVSQQAAEVLRVVPMGTSREAAMKRLKDAGVRGSFGDNESIFYCDVWNRDNGDRWHINVVLLFDGTGRLYATRPELSAGTSAAEPARTTFATEATVDPFQ
jgi:hypothetical protein